jgi:shikimate dehydrogenase
MVNKDTQLCISVAGRPSNFGTTLHNAGYAALGLNYVYKAFGVNDLAGALIGVRALHIRGCSVSMPFKEVVLPFLDDLDETARVIGAVNTIVNDAGRLVGYNTDAIGARKALESIAAKSSETVLLLGAGGAARAIVFALQQMGFKQVRVSNRDPKKIKYLDSIMSCEVVLWEERHLAGADLLINATSVGMSPDVDKSPIGSEFLSQIRGVMDVVVLPMESSLIKLARSLGKDVAPGYLMSLEQMIEQFRLYTGEAPPRDVMVDNLNRLLTN